MRIRIDYIGGHTWEIDSADGRSIETEPDRSMSDRWFWIDVRLGEHMEIDCEGGGEFECPSCSAGRKGLAEIRAERERRDRVGIELIIDMDEPTFEERYAPYGPAWQEEQIERRGGYR